MDFDKVAQAFTDEEVDDFQFDLMKWAARSFGVEFACIYGEAQKYE